MFDTSGPLQPAMKMKMKALAKVIHEIINEDKKGKEKESGFFLLTFDFKTESISQMNYISNTHREDIIKAMKIFTKEAEGK